MKYKLICGLFLLILLVACNAHRSKENMVVEPKAPAKIELQNYQGSWTDKDFNQYMCSDCLNSVEISMNENRENEGTISIFLYNPVRVTDSIADFQLVDNKADFIFDDDAGKGKGTVTFLEDEIHIRLSLEQAIDELNEVYYQERILVRDPYKGLKRYDPLELTKDYLHLKDTSLLELNSSAEYNEELEAGPEVEIVNRKDESGKVIEMYQVNTLNKKIEELGM
ncbi:hypothetical protein EHV15_01735 [Paenibacillus oralis]|uniref:Lipoprotein n=1 Tax=Paenibacillus oralis TaxID=2490856 RepID=A0A3P3TVW8_9BACL|nr:hypothetical protein [Paenibacillus oralis]RRJ61836.1 hypothetical protein EHV15_01735 [Paenibacillus oralis]